MPCSEDPDIMPRITSPLKGRKTIMRNSTVDSLITNRSSMVRRRNDSRIGEAYH